MGSSGPTRQERILVFLFRQKLAPDQKLSPVRLKEIAVGIGEPEASNNITKDLDRLRADGLIEIVRVDDSSVARYRLTSRGRIRAQDVLAQFPQIDVRAFDPSTRKKRSTVPASSIHVEDPEALKKGLRRKVRALIASHGFADPAWADAISSKYFLVGLGHILGMKHQNDYKQLLNTFLKSFDPTVDDHLVLASDRILVTNKELEWIVQHMKEEDAKDPHYTKSHKTKAENIDPSVLHFNYLHGLAAAISAGSNSKTLQLVNEFALKELFDQPSRLDEHGGWCPYRVPWITARVLISLWQCPEIRDGRDPTRKLEVERAIDSLIDRIHEGKYWRSGVGDWVTHWESTALCLEALHTWGAIHPHAKELTPVLQHVVASTHQWLIDPPDFSEEAKANATLAAVVLASVLLRIADEFDPSDVRIDKGRLLRYLTATVDQLSTAGPTQPRQFCTVPQVAYYVVNAIPEGNP